MADSQAVVSHSFLPLVKMILKTPRYRYNEKKGKFSLGVKARPISFASHVDTYIYGFYAYALNQRYQEFIKNKGFQDTVLAYRTDLDGLCNVQFAVDAFDHIRDRNECIAITLDIKGYFDSIDHQLLKEKWAKVLGEEQLPDDQYALFRSLSKYAYVNKSSLFKHFDLDWREEDWQPTLLDYIGDGTFHEKFDTLREHKLLVHNQLKEKQGNGRFRHFGIPQGLAISALLSNIYLVDFDKAMMEKAQAMGFYYRR